MGKLFPDIDERNAGFIRAQKVFFVATAPLAGDGLVNCSPKGLESFAVLDPKTVAYLDLIGSGIETVSHLRENGRVVFMFCAFEGPPRILRLHGRGEVVEPGDAEALATAVLDLASDPDRMQQLGSNARRAAELRFDMSRNVRTYVELLTLDRAVSGNSGGSGPG